jgi:hypothetical protein
MAMHTKEDGTTILEPASEELSEVKLNAQTSSELGAVDHLTTGL